MDIFALESILFAKGEAVSVKDLAKGIDKDEKTTLELCKELSKYYIDKKRGICLLEVEGKFQLASNQKYFENIRKVVSIPKKHELTEPLLETLAIIAYKQPVTKIEIEEIRGVSSSFAVNKLMEYGLVCEKGRLSFVGRPILFGTTDEFLMFYGISDLKELPALDKKKEINL